MAEIITETGWMVDGTWMHISDMQAEIRRLRAIETAAREDIAKDFMAWLDKHLYAVCLVTDYDYCPVDDTDMLAQSFGIAASGEGE